VSAEPFGADTPTADLAFYARRVGATAWNGISKSRGVSEGNVIRSTIAKPTPLRLQRENVHDRTIGRDVDILTMEKGLTRVPVGQPCSSPSTLPTIIEPTTPR
jgi:UDP-N-acetylglucosamine 3-dehydrogenase